jgi:hypothetical protein
MEPKKKRGVAINYSPFLDLNLFGFSKGKNFITTYHTIPIYSQRTKELF